MADFTASSTPRVQKYPASLTGTFSVGVYADLPVATIEQDIVLTYDFSNSASQRHQIYLYRVEARIDFDAATIANCTNVTYYINGVAVTGLQGVNWGDTIWIDADKDGASSGTVTISVSYSPGSETVNVNEFQPVQYQNLQNSAVLAQWRYDHDVLVGNDALKNWKHSAESVQAVPSGSSRFRFYWAQNQFSGIRAAAISYPTNHFTRIEFCLYCVNGVWQYYESGSNLGTLAGTYQQGYIMEMRPNTGTGKIDVYYSQDNGSSWTLWRSSTASFSNPSNFHVDVVMFPSWQRAVTPLISYEP